LFPPDPRGISVLEFAAEEAEVLLGLSLLCLGNPAIALGRSVILRPVVTHGLLFSGKRIAMGLAHLAVVDWALVFDFAVSGITLENRSQTAAVATAS